MEILIAPPSACKPGAKTGSRKVMTRPPTRDDASRIVTSNLTLCKIAIPTMSLGHCTAGHSLENKLDAAKSYGYEGVEVCYEDLVAVAG